MHASREEASGVMRGTTAPTSLSAAQSLATWLLVETGFWYYRVTHSEKWKWTIFNRKVANSGPSKILKFEIAVLFRTTF